MELPIDCRRAPFKEKYLDEETVLLKRWFIFGKHDSGLVDIMDGNMDIFTHVEPVHAHRIVTLRNEFIDKVIAVLNR